MATSIPFPFTAQIPATPPPDQPMFGRGAFPFPPRAPPKPTPQEAYGAAADGKKTQGSRGPPNPTPTMPLGGGMDASRLPDMAADPRYLAMASRIAAYYQQRCQAITNFQQQRCQAWANMHRQKCQEMMQAAMLIVAWYIRDRISRRRRKQKRSFKKRLSEKNARSKVTKGESVRRWVMQVPLDETPPANPVHDALADEDEAKFSMDKEPTPDKDSQLFNVADNLIRSQLARIDVPLLGALSFDESDSETEDEDMNKGYEDEEEDYEAYGEEQAERDDMDEDEYDDDDDDDSDEGEGEGEGGGAEIGSEVVQLGTGTRGSRKRSRSLIS